MTSHRLLRICADALLLALALVGAFLLRLGFEISDEYWALLKDIILAVVLFKLVVFLLFGLYDRIWRYASVNELNLILAASSVSSAALLVLLFLMDREIALPRSVFIVDWLLTVMFVGGLRFVVRLVSEARWWRSQAGAGGLRPRRVLVVGAGDTGETIVREMLRHSHLGYVPIGFLDDDLRKKNMTIHGVKVLGGRGDLAESISEHAVDEVIIAIPSASREMKRDIAFRCEETHVSCKIIPAMYELIDGRVHLRQIREVEIEDILGREAVEVNLSDIAAYISGKTVLITGAGGSIGSELSRQIAQLDPASLVLLDIAEGSLFDITEELTKERQFGKVAPVVGDIKDRQVVEQVFRKHQPDVVFHAAAYKHVPLLENNLEAALHNNFMGTLVTARAAAKHGVSKFVLISTDKAVEPTSVMGVSKALAEKGVRRLGLNEGMECVIVRFGNVLGSSGSVVPIFRRQIARGGPVTVTHPEMKRYFMTIPESVQLVIQAGAMGSRGEIFVLNMGEPVNITELAKNMIRLSGFEPEREIEISFVGTRPGEKFEEKLFGENEKQVATVHPQILKAYGDEDDAIWGDHLIFLESLLGQKDYRKLTDYLGKLFPSFTRRAGASAPVVEISSYLAQKEVYD